MAENTDFLTFLTGNVPCSFTSCHVVLDADSRSATASATVVVL